MIIKNLNQLRNNYLTIIYSGVLNEQALYKIDNKLLKETLKYKVTGVNKMYANVKKVLFMVQNEKNNIRLFLILDRLYHTFSKIVNGIANDYESYQKEKYFNNLIDNARKEGKVFYLCSYNKNSSEDHKSWQGKIYVDEFFDRYNKKAYEIVKEKQLDKLQWVINAPIYLGTRPYCKHSFVAISNDEVNMPIWDLLEKYNLLEDIEQETDPKPKNIKNKLDLYKKMYKVNKNKIILNYIAKYKKYLVNNY